MEKDTLKKAIGTYGCLMQIIVAIEEMAELTKELCKQLRGRDNLEEIAEEIADVNIMMEQQQIIFDCAERVKDYEEAKLQRLRDRLKARQDGETTTKIEEPDLSPKVEELSLSTRARNCLRRAGIDTVEQLRGTPVSELKKIRCMGEKTLQEIAEKLKEG